MAILHFEGRNSYQEHFKNISDEFCLNRKTTKLEIKVKFFNIYFIALLLVLLALIWYFHQKKWHLLSVKNSFVFDKKLLNLFVGILVLAGIAGASVYLDNKNTISEYEDIPVLKNFKKKPREQDVPGAFFIDQQNQLI